MTKLISIIIPLYNRVHLVRETLDSILAQTYTHWECLVVDDGSTDNTLTVIKEYTTKDARIRVFYRPDTKPKGASSCRNYGLDQATGDLIWFFDSDDMMLPYTLSNRMAFVKMFPDLDFWVFQTQRFFKTPGDDAMVWNDLTKHNAADLNDFMGINPVWHTSGPQWKREFLVKNNLYFTEGVMSWQDWEFHIRVLLLQPKYKKFIDVQAFSYQRFHDGDAINKWQDTQVVYNRLDTIYRLATQFTQAERLTKLHQKQLAKVVYFNLSLLPKTINVRPLWKRFWCFYPNLSKIDLWFWSMYLHTYRKQHRRGYYRLRKVMDWCKKVYFSKHLAIDDLSTRTWYKIQQN
ncbi:glycosyltransferase family 2 protein [Mangrovimonas spongiae]|uniref:Glycosyltransferase family 2 protein n=1 Tax=Mangrovimonas spongiae TaxID=2494697 RepID=A0A3R9MEY0_9FLAO|nr:glycosyltransferase family 2 protein [Mangrovimonas spongiae]RSK40512.1 glycosyltransferase family 2 protein [Mangrovimonas spongiae]